MAFVLGNQSRVLANGRAVSTTVSGWGVSVQRALSEVTTIVDGGARYTPGLSTGTMNLSGPQDSTGQGLHSQVAAAVGVDNSLILTVCPYGTAQGGMSLTALGDLSEWSVDAPLAETVRYQMTTQADEMVDIGFVVHPLQAETAAGNTAAVDRAAASAGGAAAVIHVTEFSGFTSVTAKIQHSTDNAVWSDLTTFSPTVAIGAQRLMVPGTINRYVRSVLAVTGTGSATYLVALEPR